LLRGLRLRKNRIGMQKDHDEYGHDGNWSLKYINHKTPMSVAQAKLFTRKTQMWHACNSGSVGVCMRDLPTMK
jgi:hypothetical protein